MGVQLITVDDVAERCEVGADDEAAMTVIETTLPAVTTSLEQRLQTRLTKGTAQEVFYIDPTDIPYGGTHRLFLRDGFVTDVTVTRSLDLGEAGTAVTPLKVLDAKGVVIIQADGPCYEEHFRFRDRYRHGYYLTVSYTYGFDDYDEALPDWLREAAFSYAVQLMSLRQLGDSKFKSNGLLEMLKDHIERLLRPNYRGDALAKKAIM